MSEMFETQAAYSPENQQLVKEALFTTHDVDTGEALPTMDSLGSPLVLRSDSNGFLPPFKVAGDRTQVEIRNGAFKTILTTLAGTAAKETLRAITEDGPVKDQLWNTFVKSVDLGSVVSAAANAGATQARPPQFSRANSGDPVLTLSTQNPAADATAPTTATSLYWPWIIDARAIFGDDALDEFYLYSTSDHAATHADSGVWLYTGPTEMGPWTSRGMRYRDDTGGSQTETATVFRDPTGQYKLIMLYQQENVSGANGVQTTLWARSNDGLTWTRGGIAIDVPSWWSTNGHTGYARVRDQGGLIAHHLAGGADLPTFAMSRSQDGRTWWIDRNPLAYQMDLVGDGRRTEWNSGDVITWNGQNWWIGLTSNFVSGGTAKDARIVIAPLSEDMRSFIGKPEVLLYPTVGDENTNYRAVRTFVGRDGALYLYYQCGNAFYVATTKEDA